MRKSWAFWVILMMGLAIGVAGCEREVLDIKAVSAEPGAAPGVDRSDQYRLESGGDALVAGEQSELALAITPGPGLKINLEFPWVVEFAEVQGVTVEPGRLGMSELDLTEERAKIPVKIQAEQAGSYQVEATANFSVCNDDRCDILREEPLSFTVHAR